MALLAIIVETILKIISDDINKMRIMDLIAIKIILIIIIIKAITILTIIIKDIITTIIINNPNYNQNYNNVVRRPKSRLQQEY